MISRAFDRLLQAHRGDAVQLLRIIQRLFGGYAVQRLPGTFRNRLEDVATDLQGVRIVFGQVVGHPRYGGVHVGPAQFFGRHLFAGGGFHQGRATQKDGALVAHDDHLVAHGRHVGPSGRARAHHHRHLRNALGRQPGLVVEKASEVEAIRKHVRLFGQEYAARIDQVNAGQAVLEGDLLGADVLLDRLAYVGAALHGGVVGRDHRLLPVDHADARHDARRRKGIVVHTVGRHRR